MSLTPFFFNDFCRSSRLMDQQFGSPLTPEDMMLSTFHFPTNNYFRPWKTDSQNALEEVGSTLLNHDDKFQISLDVQQFKPNEILVKTSDREVIIEGKHEERLDEHGFVSRQFKRRYILPDNCDSQNVISKLTADGVLVVTAAKKALKVKEELRHVPIETESNVCIKACTKNSSIENKCKTDNVCLANDDSTKKDLIKNEFMLKSECNFKDEAKKKQEEKCELLKSDVDKKDFLSLSNKNEKELVTASDLSLNMSKTSSLDTSIASSIEAKKKDYSSMTCEIMESKESFTSCEVKKSSETSAEFLSDRIAAELKMAADNFQ